MLQIRKLFCVVDPTTNNQPALARGAYIATGTGAALHAYVCTYSHIDQAADDRTEMREAEISKHEAWLERLTAPMRASGINVSLEVDWRDDWREAVAPAAERAGADLIVKSSYRRSAPHRRLLKTADWTLLRAASCPVLFVKSKKALTDGTVLASVNLNAGDEAHRKLNDAIIAYASGVAGAARVALHVVNAYSGGDQAIDPVELARRAGVAAENAHVGDAPVEAFISAVAQKVGAQLVVIGSVGRSGLSGAVVGNTAERILDHLDSDVVTLVSGG